jgi:uncharacterized coiled-coil protein SlyX
MKQLEKQLDEQAKAIADLEQMVMTAETERDAAQASLRRLQNAQRHLSNFLDTAEQMLECGNEENPLLGITAGIALLQGQLRAARKLGYESAKRIARYIVDFEEADGINADFKEHIEGAASSVDAQRKLEKLFLEIIDGKAW